MMFCWLHLILLFSFFKALWVVVAASATLGNSDKDIFAEKQSSMESDEVLVRTEFSSVGVDGLNKMSISDFKTEEDRFNNNQETNLNLETGTKDSLAKAYSGCDKICTNQNERKLNPSVPLVNADNNRMLSLIPSIIDDLSLEQVKLKESKLVPRDLSSTYELDNHNENPKHIEKENITFSSEVHFKTVKGLDQNPEVQEYITPLYDHKSSIFPVTIKEDQAATPPSLNVSNNRTVGISNIDINRNDSSVYSVHLNNSKVIPNYNIDGFTSSSDKFSKGSASTKTPPKTNKDRTLHESKQNPQIKYSEESKKKTFIKNVNDGVGSNVTLQHSDSAQSIEDSSVLLMDDEPENVSGQNRNRGAVLVPAGKEDGIEFPQHDVGNYTNGGVNASIFETNETFSTAAHGHTMKTLEESNLNIAVISGIAIAILVVSSVIGAVSFVIYRHRYWNKPHTLSDKCSNADSSGYIDDSTLRDNSEEMYSLDNDSFLNSLEAMTIQNYWTDNVKHTKL